MTPREPTLASVRVRGWTSRSNFGEHGYVIARLPGHGARKPVILLGYCDEWDGDDERPRETHYNFFRSSGAVERYLNWSTVSILHHHDTLRAAESEYAAQVSQITNPTPRRVPDYSPNHNGTQEGPADRVRAVIPREVP